MSEENVAAVRAVYEEFARGDFGHGRSFPTTSCSLRAPNCLTRAPIAETRQFGG